MSDVNGNGSAATDTQPQLNVMVQYIKDLSFENPNAPRSFGPQDKPPGIGIRVSVNYSQLSDTDFEVVLKLECDAGEGPGTLFKVELDYAGVLRVRNFPPDQIRPLMMIEGPRLLFPFARHIVADAVQNGGFPPLQIDPIDFAGLYRQNLAASEGQPAIPVG